jgi:hypothetical protein
LHRPHQVGVVDSAERRLADAAYEERNVQLENAWRGPATPLLPALKDDQSPRDQYIERVTNAYRTPTGRNDPADDVEALHKRWASPGATPGPGRRPTQDAANDPDRAYEEYCPFAGRVEDTMTTMIASDVLQHAADPTELDARIVAAFADDAKSVDVSRLLPEVEAAANAADAAAGETRARALDPLLSRDEVKLARCEMEDMSFTRDRLHEAGTKLVERVEALKALEADRRLQAEHERVLAERDRLAEEMERMAEPIAQIAHTVSRIAICDREIGRLNATSAAKFGHIPLVLSGAAPSIMALFQDTLVWDAFSAVAGLVT